MKVLIVGYGSIGQRHLNSFLRVRPAYQYAVLRRQLTADKSYPAGTIIFNDIQQVRDYSPDLICICTPSQNHHKDLLLLAPYVRNLFMEKPLATDNAAIDSCISLIRNISGKFYYGCVMRQHPALKAFKQFIEQENLGKPLSYQIHCGSYLPDWRPGQDYSKLYSAASESGGVALDLIHEFDYAEWCFGEFKKISGYRAKLSNLDIDSTDYCSTSIIHDSGVAGVITLNYYQRKANRSCMLVMENGQMELDLINSKIISCSAEGIQKIFEYPVSKDQYFDSQSKQIFESLENKNEVSWDLLKVAELNKKIIDLPII